MIVDFDLCFRLHVFKTTNYSWKGDRKDCLSIVRFFIHILFNKHFYLFFQSWVELSVKLYIYPSITCRLKKSAESISHILTPIHFGLIFCCSNLNLSFEFYSLFLISLAIFLQRWKKRWLWFLWWII